MSISSRTGDPAMNSSRGQAAVGARLGGRRPEQPAGTPRFTRSCSVLYSSSRHVGLLFEIRPGAALAAHIITSWQRDACVTSLRSLPFRPPRPDFLRDAPTRSTGRAEERLRRSEDEFGLLLFSDDLLGNCSNLARILDGGHSRPQPQPDGDQRQSRLHADRAGAVDHRADGGWMQELEDHPADRENRVVCREPSSALC